jgi:hypothetical protein
MNNLLHACLVVAGLAYLPERAWPQAIVFLAFGVVVAAKEYSEAMSAAAKDAAKAADVLASKTEQLQALDSKVAQLNERMLRYETRPR